MGFVAVTEVYPALRSVLACVAAYPLLAVPLYTVTTVEVLAVAAGEEVEALADGDADWDALAVADAVLLADFVADASSDEDSVALAEEDCAVVCVELVVLDALLDC